MKSYMGSNLKRTYFVFSSIAGLICIYKFNLKKNGLIQNDRTNQPEKLNICEVDLL